jgi:hypothetical protein
LAQLVPVEWDAAGRFSKDIPVPAGKFVEVCEKLPKGARVLWSFDAAAALSFNIHYHEGKDVRFPARKDQATQESGTLAAELDQDYCWMWTNKTSAAVTLKLQLQR